MTAPPIPYELLHRIFSHTEGKKTVLTCALVCRDWLPASRRITFSHAHSILTSYWIPGILANLLRNPHSTLRLYMTNIYLSVGRCDDSASIAIDELLQNGATVRKFGLYTGATVIGEKLGDAIVRLLECNTHNLREVGIVFRSSQRIHQFLGILSDAPTLTHLTLNYYTQSQNTLLREPDYGQISSIRSHDNMTDHHKYLVFLTSTFTPPPPSLESVETNVIGRSFLEAWIFRAKNVRQYTITSNILNLAAVFDGCDTTDRDISINGLHGHYAPNLEEGDEVRRFFSSSRYTAALSHLTLVVGDFWPGLDLEERAIVERDLIEIDLCMAVNLHSLKFLVELVCAESNVDLYLAWALKTISTAPEPSSLTCDFEITIFCSDDTEEEEVEAFDARMVSCLRTLSKWGPVSVTVDATEQSPMDNRLMLCEGLAATCSTVIFKDTRNDSSF